MEGALSRSIDMAWSSLLLPTFDEHITRFNLLPVLIQLLNSISYPTSCKYVFYINTHQIFDAVNIYAMQGQV